MFSLKTGEANADGFSSRRETRRQLRHVCENALKMSPCSNFVVALVLPPCSMRCSTQCSTSFMPYLCDFFSRAFLLPSFPSAALSKPLEIPRKVLFGRDHEKSAENGKREILTLFLLYSCGSDKKKTTSSKSVPMLVTEGAVHAVALKLQASIGIVLHDSACISHASVEGSCCQARSPNANLVQDLARYGHKPRDGSGSWL